MDTGFTMISNSLISDPSFSPNEFRILCYLLSFKAGHCYPSYISIMNATGIKSRLTVNKALRELRRLGVVTWISGKRGWNNVYTVLPEADWKLDSRVHRFGAGDYVAAQEAEWRERRTEAGN